MESTEDQQAPPGAVTVSTEGLLLKYARVRLERDVRVEQLRRRLAEGEPLPPPEMSVDDMMVRHAMALLEADGLRERCEQLATANRTLLAANAAPAEMPSPIRPLDPEAFRDEDEAAVAG